MMADFLGSTMEKLSLSSRDIDPAAYKARLEGEANGSIASQPRKRARQNEQELLDELEKEFLEPSEQFGTRWLNALQK